MYSTAEAVTPSDIEFAAVSKERAVIYYPPKLRRLEIAEIELLVVERTKKAGPNPYHVESLAAELWCERYMLKHSEYWPNDVYMKWVHMPDGDQKDRWLRYGLYTYLELKEQRRQANEVRALMNDSENVEGLMLALKRGCGIFQKSISVKSIVGYDVLPFSVWRDFQVNIERLIQTGRIGDFSVESAMMRATEMFEESERKAQLRKRSVYHKMKNKLGVIDALVTEVKIAEDAAEIVEKMLPDVVVASEVLVLDVPKLRRVHADTVIV